MAPAFFANLSLTGYFEPHHPAHDRLLPIAEAAGDGSQVALWRDDEGQQRVVLLDSEGSGFLLADDARQFLVLLAPGHRELSSFEVGLEPDDPIETPELDAYRSWLTQTWQVSIPEQWTEIDKDDFTTWFWAELETIEQN